MSALILRPKKLPPQRIDLSPVTPERLSGLTLSDIVRIQLANGNHRTYLGELFDVAGEDATNIIIQGSNARLDCVGAGLRSGSITVEGDAGAYTGLGMSGGRLHVAGSAGPWTGARMSGGTLSVAGDAGEHLGGAMPGDVRGMSGGLIVVRGNAGARAGYRMRRGIIAIQGDAGDFAGARMIAGTVLVTGQKCGAYPGYGMKRGTLLLRRVPERRLPTFADAGEHELAFIALLARALRAAEVAVELDGLGSRVRRYVGDAAAGGKGEILVWDGR